MWHILLVVVSGGLIGLLTRRRYVPLLLFFGSLALAGLLALLQARVHGVGILIVAVGVLVPLSFSAVVGMTLRTWTIRLRNASGRRHPASN